MDVRNLTGEIKGRFRRDDEYVGSQPKHYLVSQAALASLIGTVAAGLPLVFLGAWALGVDLRWSFSHYYFVPFLGDVFVGTMVFVGAVMITFKGENWYEWWLSTLAGASALLVAYFPCNESGHASGRFSARVLAEMSPAAPPLHWKAVASTADGSFFSLFPGCWKIHAGAAVVLFLLLAVFCFLAFSRVTDDVHKPDGELTGVKKTRNIIYLVSGMVILLCLALLFSRQWWDREAWNSLYLTFWTEAFMLWAFGISWIVKGRCWGTCLLDQPPPEPGEGERAVGP
jgi:hypothetical protein